MAQFIQMICPNCGGDLVKVDGDMYRCENCHVYHKIDNRNLHHDLLDVAAIRESLNFKLAEQKCRKLLQEYASSDLTDVYWNLLLCEQRVLFETDQKGAQFPSFYDIVPTDIESSENYKKCNEYLKRFDSQNAYNYEELVDKMVSAKRKYRRIKESFKPFDIFICFKKSKTESEGGGETRDYKIAYQLYNVFCKSYNVFFSEESLFNIGGVTEYEPHIYHALYTAKIMFLICSKREYLESQWVKNEWSRFKRMADNAQQTKVIIPIFVDDFTPEYLPDDIKSCQGLNNDMYLIDRLKTSVNNFLHPVDKEAELNAKIEAEVQRRLKTVTSQPVSAPVQQQTVTSKPATKPTYAPKPTTPVKPQPAVAPKPVAPNYIVPYGTTEIKDGQFKDRKDIKTAIIPNTVTSIGESAFRGCTGLESISVESGNTKYHSKGNCLIETATKTLIAGCNASIIPEDGSVTSIGDDAFYNCYGLEDILIPDSVTSIGEYAFFGCRGLTSITIPDSVTSIGYSAFWGCRGLASIIIPFVGAAKGGTSDTHFGYIFGASDSYHNSYYVPSSLKEVIITGGTSIGFEAFDGCSGLTSVTIGNSVTSIEPRAFLGCSGLTSVTIGNSVTRIGFEAFSGCKGLTTVNWNATACTSETIFNDCTNLTTINIGDNVTTIPAYAFENCNSLQYNEYDNALYLGNNQNPYVVLIKAKDTAITACTIHQNTHVIYQFAFQDCTGLTSITIPNGVTSIGGEAFRGCSGLTSITIPASITSINECAFTYCSGLKSITVEQGNAKYHSTNNCLIETATKTLILGCKNSVIPTDGSVTNIGDEAFRGCTVLTSIVIPNSVTSTGYEVFSGCSGLTSITIPDSVTSIERETFVDCSSLTEIKYNGSTQQWKDMKKGKHWNKGTGKYVVHCTDGDLKKSIFNKNI